MIDPNEIIQIKRGPNTFYPPGISLLRHGFPVIKWIPPQLPGLAEIFGDTGDHGRSGLIQMEEVRMVTSQES
jgi:hypothetical protein